MRILSTKYKAFSYQSFKQKGVSLVELLIVVSCIGFLAILVASIPNSISLIGKSNYLSTAREIGAKQIEDARSIGYENLSNGETAITDTRMNLLPKSEGLVIVQDCDVSVCTNGEELKQVIVKINWKDAGKDQEVKMTTFISENGL